MGLSSSTGVIKYSIRYKLIILFLIVILLISVGLTFIAVRSQTESLWNEKNKQARIIIDGISRSIQSKLIQIYSEQYQYLADLKKDTDYLKFYKRFQVDQYLFEDFDLLRSQNILVYAFYVGKGGYLLAHTDTNQKMYKPYSYLEQIGDYKTLHEEEFVNEIDIIRRTLPLQYIYSSLSDELKQTFLPNDEIFHYTTLISFQSKTTFENFIGEIHIGISLKEVNQNVFDTKVKLQLAAIIAIIMAMFTAFLFSLFLTQPIKLMITALKKISSGNLSASVIVHSQDEIGSMSHAFNGMLDGMRVLVSPEVAQVILSGNNIYDISQRRKVTAMFCDVRSFTSMSEMLEPTDLLKLLNGYLEFVSRVIVKYGGVIDKFIGDEVFATFGAPFDHDEQEVCAAAAILEIQEEIELFNKTHSPVISVGIGCNTGDVVSGTIGSSDKLDYTCIGDNINLASRLQGATKVYKVINCISGFTHEVIKNDFICRELDLVQVKGKEKPVAIYEVLAIKESGVKKVQLYLDKLAVEKQNQA